MAFQNSKKILDRPTTLILHAVLVGFLNDKYGFTHGSAARLVKDIVKIQDKTLLHMIDTNDDSQDQADALENFLYRIRSPRLNKAAIYEAFLIAKGYLCQDDLDRFSKMSFKETEDTPYFTISTESCDQSEDEALYFHEGSADRETLLCSLLLTKEKSSLHYKVYLQERVYQRQNEEKGTSYQDRIDQAECNIYREFFGYLFFSKYGNKLKLQEIKDSELIDIFREGKVYKENIFTIKNKNDLIYRTFKNLNLKAVKKSEMNQLDSKINLTPRIRNNIIMKSKRFLHQHNITSFNTDKFIFEIIKRNKTILSKQDKQLLQGAEDGDALEMILAIADGADINAQDPKTGWTALHWVARIANPFCLAVLSYQPDKLTGMYEALKHEGHSNIEEIDFKLRQSQEKLDPLILCHKHLFASEKSILVDWEDPSYNAYYEQQREMNLFISMSIEGNALRAKGLDPFLHCFPMEYRLRSLGIQDDKTSSCETLECD